MVFLNPYNLLLFLGCWWHGHNCHINSGKEHNTRCDKPMAELLEETSQNSAYIISQGFNLVECWKCEWLEMKKNGEPPTVHQDTSPTTSGQQNDYDERNDYWCCIGRKIVWVCRM